MFRSIFILSLFFFNLPLLSSQLVNLDTPLTEAGYTLDRSWI